MKSQIEDIMNTESLTDTQKKDQLYARLKTLIGYLSSIHTALADENSTLDDLMDANGNNSEEHHAKTMVFYGRKLSIRDLFLGVSETDTSHTMPPEVPPFTGMDLILSQNDWGRVKIIWDCWHGTIPGSSSIQSLDSIWKTDSKPISQPNGTLIQYHTIGSKVTMPSIRNMDTDGEGTGTNNYKLKSGYTITGWTFKSVEYLYDDYGNDYVYKMLNGSPQQVRDLRTFAFGSNTYKLPFNSKFYLTASPAKVVEFVLNVIPIWYNIEFVVRHGTVAASAPCKTPISTRLGNTITLPIASLITMESGWDIDKDKSPYGTWTTKDPQTGLVPPDPDGDPLEEMEFNADTNLIVGQDIDAGVRRLFLKVKQV